MAYKNTMTYNFPEIYKEIKPAIVAIASKISSNFEMPDIIGTGFIVREDGIIFTNNHVIRAMEKLPRTKSMPDSEYSATVLLFKFFPDKGMAIVPLEIEGIGVLKRDVPFEGHNYGPDLPDLGFIKVKVKGLPILKIAKDFDLNEGDYVMTAGFPMGTETLRAPGWLHQLTPVLSRGIISSLLPFPCDDPHAMLLGLMSHGGSSGSPVLHPNTGEVVGIVYGGLIEHGVIKVGQGLPYKRNTMMTSAIPGKIVKDIYDKIQETRNFSPDDEESLEDLMKRYKEEILPPKTGKIGNAVDPNQIIFPSKL